MINTSVVDNINVVTGKQSAAEKSSQSNYEDFLKLLTTQLQNQDPSDPMDTNAMTQQIAALSQVEQQINTNKSLEKLITMYNSTQFNSLVSYIGKYIESPGDQGSLMGGKASFAYYLPKEADSVKVTVTDASGNVVVSKSGTKIAGRNLFEWDGKNTSGNMMPDGIYKIKVEAKDANQNAIESTTYTTGRVTSIDSANGSVYLSIGNLAVPFDKIVAIRDTNS